MKISKIMFVTLSRQNYSINLNRTWQFHRYYIKITHRLNLSPKITLYTHDTSIILTYILTHTWPDYSTRKHLLILHHLMLSHMLRQRIRIRMLPQNFHRLRIQLLSVQRLRQLNNLLHINILRQRIKHLIRLQLP